jgi:predicted dehydrogenase
MPGKLKAAVIGCGRIGAEFDKDPKRKYIATHVGAYAAAKNIDLVGVVDPDEKKLDFVRKRWPKVRFFYSSIEELLSKQKIDLVSVCTPAATHLDVVKSILKQSSVKGIFCEKPITTNVKDAMEMISLCKKRKVVLQIDHQRRFDALHQALKKDFSKGLFGKLQQANFYYTAGIWNTGTHMFDLLSMLFGQFEWVQAASSHITLPQKNDTNLDGMLKIKNGASVSFQACDVKKYLLFELNAYFEKAQIKLTHSGFELEVFKPKDSPLFSGYQELVAVKSPYKFAYPRKFMTEAIKELTQAVTKKKSSISAGEDGLRALQLIQASLLSAKNKGKRIYL